MLNDRYSNYLYFVMRDYLRMGGKSMMPPTAYPKELWENRPWAPPKRPPYPCELVERNLCKQ